MTADEAPDRRCKECGWSPYELPGVAGRGHAADCPVWRGEAARRRAVKEHAGRIVWEQYSYWDAQARRHPDSAEHVLQALAWREIARSMGITVPGPVPYTLAHLTPGPGKDGEGG